MLENSNASVTVITFIEPRMVFMLGDVTKGTSNMQNVCFTTSNIHVRGSSPITEYTHQIPLRNHHKYKYGKYNITACHVSSKLVGVRETRLGFSKALTSQHQAVNRGLNDPFCDHQQSLSKFAWCAAASPLVRSKDLKSFSPG